MNAGMSQEINSFVFVAWQVIMKEEIVLRLDLVTLMVVKEIIITYWMASHRLTQRMGEWCLHWRGASSYTHIDFQAGESS